MHYKLKIDCVFVIQEEKAKQKKKDSRKDRKRKADDETDEYVDNDIAAMMGFGGFGSSKK